MKLIKECPIGKLIPFEDNPRLNDQAIPALVKSIEKFGFINPIICDETHKICAGHTRYKAALSLGLATVPVLMVPDLTGDKFIGYNIADNQTATLAEWDEDQLASLLADLDQSDFDLGSLGFESDNLADILARMGGKSEGKTDPDAVPDPPATPVSKTGDLWLLGQHRLLCGDATKADDVAKLMDGAKADMVTDPPYGMRLDTDWTNAVGKIHGGPQHGKKHRPVIGDDEDYDPRPMLAIWPICNEAFLFGADYYAERIPSRVEGSWLVWDKRKESQADGIGSEFELIWSKARHKRRVLRHDWFGMFSTDNASDARSRLHPTQKPITLIVDIIEQWCEAMAIADPYIGSGTTIIAAEQLGRKCYGMEIDPIYCDVSVKRWEDFTGLKAELCSV